MSTSANRKKMGVMGAMAAAILQQPLPALSLSTRASNSSAYRRKGPNPAGSKLARKAREGKLGIRTRGW